MRAGRRTAHHSLRPGDGGARHHGVWQCRAAKALSARHRQRRSLVEPGLQRTGLGLGPGQRQDPRRARGQQIHRQRPEDLDHAGPVWRLDVQPGAHQHGRQAADRHLLPAAGHEIARRHGAPDQAARRRVRGQRSLLRQRRSAGREPDWRRKQGLDLRQAPAQPRAHQHRRREPQQARARTFEAHRQARRRVGPRRRRCRCPALARPDRPARSGHRGAGNVGAARVVR